MERREEYRNLAKSSKMILGGEDLERKDEYHNLVKSSETNSGVLMWKGRSIEI